MLNKKTIILPCLLALPLLTLLPCIHAAAQDEPFPISDLVTAIKNEIESVRATEAGTPRIKIDKIDIDISVTAELNGESGVKFHVAGAEIGGQVSKIKSTKQIVHISLIPTGNPTISERPAMGLATAIHSIKQAIKSSLASPPPYNLDKFIFEFDMAIEKKVGGNLSFFIIDLLEAQKKGISTHHIIITMSLAN